MKKILFVCLGNICRSPMAEAIFNHQVHEKGLQNDFMADSAGTANYHVGDQPDHRTIEVLNEKNIIINHQGRQFNKNDVNSFDYLIAMDSQNQRDMRSILQDEDNRVLLIRDFDPIGSGDVPDPYYGGSKDFKEVYEILARSIEQFIHFLIR